MAVAIISPVPRRVACLWSRARAGREGRRWAGEGRQSWVGSAALASLMGWQTSTRYVGMQATNVCADVRGFKKTLAEKQVAGTQPTYPPTTHASSSHLWLKGKQQSIQSSEAVLLSLDDSLGFLCPSLHVFFFSQGAKTVFLSSLTSHNALHCYQWELKLFPAFSTTAAIFPMLSFHRTHLGHWGYQTENWKKSYPFNGHKTLHSITALFIITFIVPLV